VVGVGDVGEGGSPEDLDLLWGLVIFVIDHWCLGNLDARMRVSVLLLLRHKMNPKDSYYSSDRATASFAVARFVIVYSKIAGEASYGAVGWGVDE
jgi:hypothetical protein